MNIFNYVKFLFKSSVEASIGPTSSTERNNKKFIFFTKNFRAYHFSKPVGIKAYRPKIRSFRWAGPSSGKMNRCLM